MWESFLRRSEDLFSEKSEDLTKHLGVFSKKIFSYKIGKFSHRRSGDLLTEDRRIFPDVPEIF